MHAICCPTRQNAGSLRYCGLPETCASKAITPAQRRSDRPPHDPSPPDATARYAFRNFSSRRGGDRRTVQKSWRTRRRRCLVHSAAAQQANEPRRERSARRPGPAARWLRRSGRRATRRTSIIGAGSIRRVKGIQGTRGTARPDTRQCGPSTPRARPTARLRPCGDLE